MTLRRAVLALVLALPGPCPAPAPARAPSEGGRMEEVLLRDKLWSLFHQYLARVAELDPERATEWGMREGDPFLTSRDDETPRRLRSAVERFLILLDSEIGRDGLASRDRWDYDLFERHLKAERLRLALSRDRELSPRSYLRLESVSWHLDKDHGGVDSRGALALARLKAMPLLLQQGRATLTRPPRVWTEAAIVEAAGARAWFRDLLKGWFLQAERFEMGIKTTAEAALPEAAEALEDYEAHLKEVVLARSSGDFAAGPGVYRTFLESRHGLNLSPSGVRRLCKAEFRRARRELRSTAEGISPGVRWLLQAEAAAREAPPPERLAELYREEAVRMRGVLERARVMTLPRSELFFVSRPAYLRPYRALGHSTPPGRLDSYTGGTLYLASPDPDAPEPQARARYALEANQHAVQVHLAGAALPGSQIVAVRAKDVASPIRRALWSEPLMEGWTLYARDLAEEAGLYSSEFGRLFNLRARMVAALEGVLDVDLHTGGLGLEEAARTLMEEGGLALEDARAEALRLTLEPTRAAAAVAGYRKIWELRRRAERKLGGRFTLLEFHDRLLAFGALPTDLSGPVLIKEWGKEARP